MIEIDRLSIQLPAGFEHRASDIGMRVGHVLGDYSVTSSQRFESLSLPPLSLNGSETNEQIAQQIASNIGQAIGARPSTQGVKRG